MTGALRLFLGCLGALALAGCATTPEPVSDSERAEIGERLMRDISVLASDEFEGRKPGTSGEDLTVEYVIRQFEAAGLSPGTNIPGSPWRAPVALTSVEPQGGTLTVVSGDRETSLNTRELAFFTTDSRTLVSDAEMLFVGYRAEDVPAEQVMGRVVVMLGEEGKSPARRRSLFTKGPAAIVTVTDSEIAIRTLRRTYGREVLSLAGEGVSTAMAMVSDEGMERALGEDVWRALRNAAQGDDFRPVLLPTTASLDARTKRREFESGNLIGVLPGLSPETGAVLLIAHWDHLGRCGDDGQPDAICNGAIDNASGVASLLELARRLAASGPHDRDIYFVATTAEESGLLGAKAFLAAPPKPLDTFIAAFNFDTVALAPAGSPVGFVGEGRTALDALIREAIEAEGRQIGDREFAESFVKRQDSWALLQEGVPAVFVSSAFGSPDLAWPYLEGDYHRVSDEVQKIELGGAIDDLLLHEGLIRRIASAQDYSPSENQVVGGAQD